MELGTILVRGKCGGWVLMLRPCFFLVWREVKCLPKGHTCLWTTLWKSRWLGLWADQLWALQEFPGGCQCGDTWPIKSKFEVSWAMCGHPPLPSQPNLVRSHFSLLWINCDTWATITHLHCGGCLPFVTRPRRVPKPPIRPASHCKRPPT